MRDDDWRASCTPITVAGSVLSTLTLIYEGWFPTQDFLETFFKFMWDDEETSGANQVSELQKIEELVVGVEEFGEGEILTVEGKEALVKIGTLMVSCAFCVQAMKARKGSKLAWSYALDATQWLGIFQGLISGSAGANAITRMAKNGAAARHAENRSMKLDVFAWLDVNRENFKSMDATAAAITKQQPIAFRTARDWVGDWKKLRSASTT